MNGIVFLISFLMCLAFVYRKATEYGLNLCSATWLNGVTSCRSFLMKYLGSFIHGIIICTNFFPFSFISPLIAFLI